MTSAASGRARAVLLAGEAGGGKSRLVRELVDGLGSASVLRAQCVDLGEPGLPYLVLVDIARAIRAMGAGDPEAAAVLHASPSVARLADAPAGTREGPDADPDAGPGQGAGELRHLRLFDATVGVLGELARLRGPVVVVVEDLQWVDSSSATFLTFLLRRMAAEHLVVVMTVRTEGLAGRPRVRQLLSEIGRLSTVQRVELDPFTETEVTAYLESTGGERVEPGLAAEVARRTGGNPYFVATLAANGALGALGDGVPPALADLLVGRVDGLAEAARDIVHAIAVGTQPVPDPVLRKVVGPSSPDGHRTVDDVDGALREAMAEGVLITVGTGYALAHDLLRVAVHDALLPGERLRWHAAYGRALESGTGAAPAAEVAHHFVNAELAPKALEWSVRAAEHAMAVLAPAEALEQLERSLALWPVVEDAEEVAGVTHAGLVVRAARAAGLAGETPRATEWASLGVRLSDGAGDRALGVQARAELVRHLIAADATDHVVAPAQDGLRLAAELRGAEADATTVARAQVTLARALLAARRTDEARPQAERAVAAAHSAGAKGLEVDALTTAAFLDEVAGDRDAAAHRLRDALSLARAEGELAAELRVHYTLACLHYYNGDVAGSLPVLNAAMKRVTDSGLRWSDPGVELRLLLAAARYAVGDLPGSLAALASVQEGRPPDAAAARLAAVACYAAVALGAPDAGRRLADLESSWDADPQVALVAGGCSADHFTWAGDTSAAVAAADKAQLHLDATVGEGMYGGLWLSALGLTALADAAAAARRARDDGVVRLALGQGDELLNRVTRLVESGRGRPGDLGPEGRAWHARAVAEHARLAGRPAVEEWRGALEGFGYGHVYEQARCRWRLAEALVEVGERDEARVQAMQAASAAREMGAIPLQRAIEATVRGARLGAAAAGAGARGDGAGAVLTPREREVLALVAEGLTNREIGRRLYISEKTASVHLSNLMAKLNVSSRTEAVTVAVRRGLHDVT